MEPCPVTPGADDTLLVREDDGLHAIAEIQFLEQAGDVGLDGRLRDEQAIAGGYPSNEPGTPVAQVPDVYVGFADGTGFLVGWMALALTGRIAIIIGLRQAVGRSGASRLGRRGDFPLAVPVAGGVLGLVMLASGLLSGLPASYPLRSALSLSVAGWWLWVLWTGILLVRRRASRQPERVLQAG